MIGRLRDRAVDAGYALGWAVVKALPERVAAAAFRLGADIAYRRRGKGVRRLAENLARVAPAADLDALTRRAVRSYARYWLETFRLPVMDKRAVAAAVPATGTERLDAALAAGRGVVIALPHMGNWDVAGIWLVSHIGEPFTTVAERLRPDSLFRRFVAYREGLGMEVLPLGRGERARADVLAARLRAGKVVALVADRDLAASGVPVRFFGEWTKMPAGPAFLAATTGAALVPVKAWYDGDGWGLHFHSPVPLCGERLRDRVRAATQRLADVFAADIAEHPQDWHMLQRMWLDGVAPPAAEPDPGRSGSTVASEP